MTRRAPRLPIRPRGAVPTGRYGEGRAGRASSPWVIRGVVIVAVVILVVAIAVAAAQGILFDLPSR